MPPTTTILEGEDSDEDEYEHWVDEEIKRFQCVLGEIGEVEEELRGMREVGDFVWRGRRWVEGIWEGVR